ncbi:glucokinase [Rhodovulum sp. DZ06]|uniref:glucokinase n=1 Tax=Rhodovulum sp. DZ06 TaxID=3425126 RepID=UPI003D33C37D
MTADPVILVADVGGTNARFALMQGGRMLAGPQGHLNAGFESFEASAAAFLARAAGPRPDAVCAAFAGPVRDGRARLTNHAAWPEVEAGALAAACGAGLGIVLNDLGALGHGLHRLSEGQAADYVAGAGGAGEAGADAGGNGQALAVGFGTGTNICAVLRGEDGRRRTMAAEFGHASLPSAVAALLPEGASPGTVEDWFCGRGVARLDAALHGREGREGAALAAALAAGDASAAATADLFASMAGALCRDLALQFMPGDGLFLAGSVARGMLLRDGAAARFAAQMHDHPDPRFAALVATIPVRMVLDDMAALTGCAAAAEAALAAG